MAEPLEAVVSVLRVLTSHDWGSWGIVLPHLSGTTSAQQAGPPLVPRPYPDLVPLVEIAPSMTCGAPGESAPGIHTDAGETQPNQQPYFVPRVVRAGC